MAKAPCSQATSLPSYRIDVTSALCGVIPISFHSEPRRSAASSKGSNLSHSSRFMAAGGTGTFSRMQKRQSCDLLNVICGRSHPPRISVQPEARPSFHFGNRLSGFRCCCPQLSGKIRGETSRAWIYVVIIAGAVAASLFFFGRYPSSKQGAEMSEKSIAVLPFENRSEDKANAYFAEGVQDEILTRLSRIADLKVTSRTSTQHYKSVPENLAEIAKQLGVAHILEGSVQKSGDAVRVNVQLIKADNDSQVWAETFDRKLTDIFSVESDVAKAIADQLRAHITRQEEQVIAAKPTKNIEAYD